MLERLLFFQEKLIFVENLRVVLKHFEVVNFQVFQYIIYSLDSRRHLIFVFFTASSTKRIVKTTLLIISKKFFFPVLV